LFSTLVPALAVSGMTLIVGCGDESKKGLAQAPVVSVEDRLSVTKAEAPKPDAVAPVPDELPSAPKAPRLSAPAEAVVQLARASVGDEVLLAFIEQSSGAYQLQVDEILYLHDVGLSAPVIAAMVRRDEESSKSNAAASELAGTDGLSVQSPVAPSPAGSVSTPTVEPASVTLSSETPQTASVDGPAAETVTNNYFYDSLSPYGNWVQVANYGWCWQPTVAVINPGWRPYCDNGRWLWSSSGWYWQSSYSWGWAPFHYGRWFCGTSGWMWVPGTVWGPSWVTWCNSGSFSGWAPLPPSCGFTSGVGLTFGGGSVGVSFGFGLANNCWTFVPRSFLCNSPPRFYCVPQSRVPTMINNGTIVNNYVNGSGNNTVINVGPGIDQVARVSRTEVRKVMLRDANPAAGETVRSDRLDRSGGTLTVFRPNLPTPAAAPPERVLARQQEVRRGSETLVRSDVVRLARAETLQRTTATRAAGTPVAGVTTSRVTPSSGLPIPSASTLAPRNEVRSPSRVQPSRTPLVSETDGRRVASLQSSAAVAVSPRPLTTRSEVRATPGTIARPVQRTATPGTYSGPSGSPAGSRPATSPAPVYAPLQTQPSGSPPARVESRNPAGRPTGVAPRTYQPVAPAPAGPTIVPSRQPARGGFNSAPPVNVAPRSYSPPPAAPAPAMRSAPVRSSPTPSYSPGPTPSRSQPAARPSSGGRSGPGRGTP